MRHIPDIRRIFARIVGNPYFIITLVLAVGLAPVYIMPGKYFPENDLTDQLYPFLIETKRMLSAGTPWWTWNSFLGDNFIGSYAYYTFTRPLLLAVCLLPYRYVGAGLAAVIYLNFLILGWLTSYYLRVMGFGRRLRIIGSLLFTLSNYMVCHFMLYSMFFEPVQAFIILLICIERYLHGCRFSCALLTLASFAVAFVNYYFMPATFIAASMYFLCRTLCCYRDRWLRLTLKAAGCVCLGVMMAAVILVPVAMYLAESSRLNSPTTAKVIYGCNWIIRALSLVAPMAYEGKLYLINIDTGWYMNTVYVGIFGLFAFIMYAMRHRRGWLTLLCIIYIICLVTPLNGIFCGFTNPYYSRWSYASIMMLLVATLYYLKEHHGRVIPLRPTLIYAVATLCVFIVVYGYSVFVRLYKGEIRPDTVWDIYFAGAFLFLLNTCALLLLTKWPVLSRKWTAVCITSIAVIAIVQTLHCTYRQSPVALKKPDVYSSAVRMSSLVSCCDTFASRYHFESHPGFPALNLNHHLISRRPAVTSYISTLNPATSQLGSIILGSNFLFIIIDRYQESAVTLLSVKDFDRFGDYPFNNVSPEALRGDRYIPMGMAYDKYSLTNDSITDVKRAETHDILRGMLASLVIDKADEPELSRYMRPVEFCDTLPFDSLVAARRAHTCDYFKGDTHGFTATVTLPDTMVVMFSTAADPGFTATIDGKPAKIYNVNMGMSASIVPAGRHTIRYEYFPPGLRTGALISLVAWAIFLILFTCEYSAPYKYRLQLV